MDRIVAEEIRGVVFLSGDIHYGEVNQIIHTRENKNTTLYEVASSPLTAGVEQEESNPSRLDVFEGEQDQILKNNFVTLDFEGPLSERKMIIRFWDSDGNLCNQKADAEPGVPTDASVILANELGW